MKVWVLIPAYNEGHALGYLLKGLRDRGLSSMVVDDGSVDDTEQIAKENADIVLRNQKNCGKGMSLKRGVTELLKNESFDYLITMDADGQHSPDDLDSFLKAAEDGHCCAIGNRMNEPRQMPMIRILTNLFMSWLISKIAGQWVPDTQCGYRLIRRDVLEKIEMETNKFEMESEFIIKAARNNFRISSIPIKSIYFKNAKSKINPLIDTIRFIKMIFRLKNEKQ